MTDDIKTSRTSYYAKAEGSNKSVHYTVNEDGKVEVEMELEGPSSSEMYESMLSEGKSKPIVVHHQDGTKVAHFWLTELRMTTDEFIRLQIEAYINMC